MPNIEQKREKYHVIFQDQQKILGSVSKVHSFGPHTAGELKAAVKQRKSGKTLSTDAMPAGLINRPSHTASCDDSCVLDSKEVPVYSKKAQFILV